MRIVVPFTSLRDETVDALAVHAHEHDLHFVDVSDHDEALWETWQWIWASPQDTIVVEHDIVIHNDVLAQFSACSEPFCTFGYRYAHFGVYHGTGCVRVQGSLMSRHPRLIEHIGEHEDSRHGKRHWCSLDAYMQHELRSVGVEQHRHEPPVTHLGVGVAHGCVAAPITV